MKRKSLLLATAILLAHQPDLAAQEPADAIPGDAAPRQPQDMQIEEIVTVGQYVRDEKRATATVSNVLDTESLQRAGDSNMADGLKRISGLNLATGGFIHVRGLNERYSNAMINGSTLPSPEPVTRAIPLDLFPSSIIDSVMVQKTYSAQFPAEFAGGTINMRTKAVPDESFFQVSTSIGMRDNTTFEDGLEYQGGDKDWMGKDDGSRDMPGPLKAAVAGDRELRQNNMFYQNGFSELELEQLGESLPRVYTARSTTIEPDKSMSATFGTRSYRGEWSVGLLSNLNYSNSWQTLEVSRNAYTPDANGELGIFNQQTFDSTQQNIDASMLWIVGAEYANEHSVKASLLQIRKSDDLAGQLNGLLGTEGEITRQTRLEWIERDLLVQQLEGEHLFSTPWQDLTLDWHYNESRAKRDAPDMRQYRYDLNQTSGDYVFCLRAICNQRVWSELQDDNEDFGLSASVELDTPFDTYTSLVAGLSRIRKERDSELRRFSLVSQGSLSNNMEVRTQPTAEQIFTAATIDRNGFQIRESTQPTDNYRGTQELDAWFVEADVEFGNSFRLLAGARNEESVQEVVTFDLFNPNQQVVGSLESDDIFPSVTGTWIADEWNMQFRLGYSETISRPDFRELSRAPFIHPVTGLEIVGNPDLTVAYIQNYDARWEWYFSADESLSLGLFQKNFDAPIEAIIEPGVNDRRTFVNARSGEVRGVELDGFRWLGFLHDDLANFYTAFNLTLIDSKVRIRPEDIVVMTQSERRLQGQADYIMNLQLGYDDLDRHKVGLVYHITGERIREAGVLGAPDVLDEPYGELDLTYTLRWNDQLSFNAKAKNLSNSLRESTQGGLDFNSWREGRSYSLSLSYDFQ